MLSNLSDFTLLLILFVALVLLYFLNVRDKNIYYYIEPALNNPDFLWEVRKILHNSSINNTHKIMETDTRDMADIIIHLVPRNKMIELSSKKIEYYPNGKQIYFSWTYQFPKPTIYIDEINWNYGVAESGLTLTDYRKYIIQHEFMHALGYDHQQCNAKTANNGVCPIMYQSTRGCPNGYKCGYEVTPVDYSKKISGSYF